MPKYDISKFYSFYYKETDLLHFFSMADHKSWGVKLGMHNLFELKHEEDNMEFQKKFFEEKAKMIFGDEFVKINKIENCYYTVTKTNDFILDWVDPASERILVCSCCSGHGFKFSPIMGEIAAEILIGNKDKSNEPTSNEVFNKWKHMFKFAYHEGMNLN
jgi:sarcosine oxidase